jgi:hypothetical protein
MGVFIGSQETMNENEEARKARTWAEESIKAKARYEERAVGLVGCVFLVALLSLMLIMAAVIYLTAR